MKKRAVVALVIDGENILIGRKSLMKKGFLRGKWHIPGETVENGETDEEALKRGISEEAGIEIEVLQYIGKHSTPKHTVVKWYECRPLSTDIIAGSDLDEVSWVRKEDAILLCDNRATELWPKEVLKYFDL